MGIIRLWRRTFVLALAVLLLLPAAAAAAYTDTSGNWAEKAIEKWSGEYGILQGYDDGTFRPDNTITRGAFAGIMARFLQYQTEAPAETFSDTAGDYWESAILKLNAANVYLGTSGKALIYNDITRQQAVTMIARAFGVSPSSESLSYADADQVADYAKGYVAAMKADLTDVGSNRRFRPTDAITRAEVVNILNNMITVLYQKSGDYSASTAGTVMINAASGTALHDMTISGDLIIAPGVTGTVTLNNVTICGSVRNLGSADVEKSQSNQSGDSDQNDQTSESGQSYISFSGKQIPVLSGVQTNPLTADDFSWKNGRLVCTSDAFTTQFGIDVAAYQNRNCDNNTIDWDAVADDGVQFALVRIALRGTSSGTLFPDAFYSQNVDGAMSAGIKTGVYIFSQATTVDEAVEEADYVIQLLDGRKLTGPVAYDWEMKDSTYRVYGTDPAVATACAEAFCQRIEKAGYQAMIYCSKYVGYTKFDLSQLTDYPIWYPEYKYTSTNAASLYPNFYYHVDYWQFSDSLSIDGIGGKVDADLQFIRK